jgi:hypothetical protein
VKFVLAAMATIQLMATEFPKWLIKKIEKLQRAFLWASSDTIHGGKCLMKWSQVCTPFSLGVLGIPSLFLQSSALKVRWLWQNAVDDDKAWLCLRQAPT